MPRPDEYPFESESEVPAVESSPESEEVFTEDSDSSSFDSDVTGTESEAFDE